MSFDAQAYLQSITEIADEKIDLARCAIALAAVNHRGLNTDRYFNHLEKIAHDVGERYQQLLKERPDGHETKLEALKDIIAGQYEYTGDRETYDDLQNADLIRVIERRKGLPIALCILYIHAGQAQRWDVRGLNLPGHFICRIEQDGKRTVFDPFDHGAVLQASDLRILIKTALGPKAELSSDYYKPATSREILIRLQNNIKLRQIEAEDYEGALRTIELMRLIDPDEYRLFLDAGVLYARVGQPLAAIRALESYIAKTPLVADREEALQLIHNIRETLN